VIDGNALARTIFVMYFGEIAADIEEPQKGAGRKAKPSDVEGPTWALKLLGDAFTAGEFVQSIRQWNTFARQMASLLSEVRSLSHPTTAFPPMRIGAMKPELIEERLMNIINTLNLSGLLRLSGIADKLAIKGLAKMPYTQLANLTGLPAMSVPLHWTEDGLPCGVQFIAPFGDEATLFRLAGQLEKAQPWFDRRPVL